MERAFWQAIIDKEYLIPSGYTVQTLTPELLTYLGVTDAELRDTYGYPILDAWIERGHYSSNELRALGQQMAQNIGMGLGEEESDTVFLRSSSTLILNAVLNYDNHYPFLTEQEVRGWFELTLDYFAREQDLRGYVEGKGWAHAIAHVADLLMILARSRCLLATDLERILNAIADKLLSITTVAFMHMEDERLTYAVMAVLRRGIVDQAFLYGWLDRMIYASGRERWKPKHFTNAEGPVVYANVRNFLRSLYFQLSLAEKPPAIAQMLRLVVRNALKIMDLGFYTLR